MATKKKSSRVGKKGGVRAPVGKALRGAGRSPHRPGLRHTIARQWRMLQILPAYPATMTSRDICDKLKPDYAVDPNTVRRDLKELSSVFGIGNEPRSKTDHWFWSRNQDFAIRAMTVPEMAAFRLVEEYLRQLLPTELFKEIEGPFNRARSSVATLKAGNETVAGYEKFRAVVPTQPMVPPRINSAVHETICRALLKGRRIRTKYRSLSKGKSIECVLNPLGMILRPPAIYLVATSSDGQDRDQIRLFALHRFDSTDELDEVATIPKGFNLEREIEEGLADFVPYNKKGSPIIEIELLVSKFLARILQETPLAVRGTPPQSNQSLSAPQNDGRTRIRAGVNDSQQLRWWLRSWGDAVEVLAPDHLRSEFED